MTTTATAARKSEPIQEVCEEVLPSSGNIYADMGLRNPDMRMAKSVLAFAITQELKTRHMTQQAAADLLGTDRAKISDLQRGRLTHFTFDRLIRFLNALGCSVQIGVTRTDTEHGQTTATSSLSA